MNVIYGKVNWVIFYDKMNFNIHLGGLNSLHLNLIGTVDFQLWTGNKVNLIKLSVKLEWILTRILALSKALTMSLLKWLSELLDRLLSHLKLPPKTSRTRKWLTELQQTHKNPSFNFVSNNFLSRILHVMFIWHKYIVSNLYLTSKHYLCITLYIELKLCIRVNEYRKGLKNSCFEKKL